MVSKARTLKNDDVFGWYDDIVANRIVPVIGGVRIEDVSRRTLQHWVAEIDAIPGYAKATRRGWWNVVKQMMLDMAAEYGLPDPTERVKPPKRHDPSQPRESRALTRVQLDRFLEAFRKRYANRYSEVVMLASTGCASARCTGCCGIASTMNGTP